MFSDWYDSTPAKAGFEPWIFRSRGGRLNHLANEAQDETTCLAPCGVAIRVTVFMLLIRLDQGL